MEIEFGQFANALATANKLADFSEKHPDVGKIVKHASQVGAAIASGRPISSSGRVGECGNWSYELLRNRFSLDIEEGVLDGFELRWHI